MKNTKRIIAMVFVLVFMFTLVMSSAVFAGADNGKDIEKVKGNDKVNTPTVEDKSKVKGAEEDSTAVAEEEKAVKEKDKVMEQKKVLMKQLIEARKSGNLEAAALLLTQVKEYKEQLKQMVKDSYTEEELAQLEQAAVTIETADPTLEVLPIDTIVAKGKSLKLDMPPVVKDGKVLVPIRAFSQAYGAEVNWNAEEHTITIIKDGVEIVLMTDSSTVYVNGVATDIGLPVKGINGKTVMPVGFLAEKLGLKAEVDPEDGTIEIEDEDDDTTTDTTTGTTTGN
ncbi:MAG TPA: stalk domain-containing protein [Clostridia bacterium]|nr:stalk domain-containing protein [Clostridia bacterium]